MVLLKVAPVLSHPCTVMLWFPIDRFRNVSTVEALNEVVSLLSTYTCMVVTGFESVLPATTWTKLWTKALGAGVQTVTDGLV